jgi:membrane protein
MANLLLGIYSKFKAFWVNVWEAIVDTVSHDGVEHAGYLSFLALFAIFPFLVFFISIAGSFGATGLGNEFVTVFLSAIPKEAATALRPRIDEIISGPPQGLLTIAILGAIWTASSAVEGMRTIFNRAYRVSTPPAYIPRRLLSILQFFVITSLILSAMGMIVIFPLVANYFEEFIHIDLYAYKKYSFILPALLIFFAVSFLYYVIPNLKQRWIDVFPGAALVLFAWYVVGKAFSAYLQDFNQVNLIYGSLASLIIALLFFYIIAMILVFGAEFNYRIEKKSGFKFKEKITKNRKKYDV